LHVVARDIAAEIQIWPDMQRNQLSEHRAMEGAGKGGAALNSI
jgi:hypothetical protein